MNRERLLIEGDLSLEFLVQDSSGNWDDWRALVADAMGSDGYLVQERIIVPTSRTSEVVHRLAGRNLCRSTRPLILTGHECIPLQFSGVVVRSGTAKIERPSGAVKVTTEGLNLLFGEPACSPQPFVTDGFYATFLQMDRQIRAANMVATDIARTWLYMADIARDYAHLKRARKRYFSSQQIDPAVFLPASTGIQGISPQGHHLIVDFWACSGNKVSKERCTSPLQCEPTQYEVFFSRVVRVSFPHDDLLLMSGTASIDKLGETLHRRNCGKQMLQTLAILEAILEKNNASFENVAQAIIYVKHDQDLALCLNIMQERGFPVHRSLLYITDVCRQDLLCEIEAHAIIPKSND